ncbi:hypothetical protein VNO77_01443 [Canavalia gladiata]|uniref:Uncharacterized protein n=1 Tax=Canavalia gladiata TaxID=3824 RepID=A0AAN9MXQ6_CANGL
MGDRVRRVRHGLVKESSKACTVRALLTVQQEQQQSLLVHMIVPSRPVAMEGCVTVLHFSVNSCTIELSIPWEIDGAPCTCQTVQVSSARGSQELEIPGKSNSILIFFSWLISTLECIPHKASCFIRAIAMQLAADSPFCKTIKDSNLLAASYPYQNINKYTLSFLIPT